MEMKFNINGVSSTGIPIDVVAQLISRYIYEQKGVLVPVIISAPDDTPNMELFLKAANIVMYYYGI